ncbi:FtsX-like permease family protein [Microbacterium sp. DT81.1]|uniref:FtsX-like permease family protein n=1 Tax=Microbacterium sp. DT81.1 TaxID=3393413 RepID=UPI003CFB0D6E
MIRGLSTPALFGRHLRTAPGASLAVALLVLVLSALAVLAPLAITAVSDAGLRYRLDGVSPLVRDVDSSVAQAPQVMPGASDLPEATVLVWGGFEAALLKARTDAGTPLTGVLGDPSYVVRMGRIEPWRSFNLSWALDPRFADRIELVDGSMPAAPPEDWWEQFGHGPQKPVAERPPIEVVLSEESAADMEWPVGETRPYPLAQGFEGDYPYRLSGVYQPVHPDDPYWLHAGDVLAPAVRYDGENQAYVYATGFADPGWLTVLQAFDPVQTTVWYPFDPGAVTAQNAGDVLADLRGFTSVSQPITRGDTGIGITGLTFRSGAIPVLERAVAEGRVLVALVAMLAAGPVGVAAAVLVLGGRMMLERRRSALALLSARGAGSSELRLLMGIEGLIVAAPAVAAGVALGYAVAAATLSDVGAMPNPLQAPAILLIPALLGIAPSALLAVSSGSPRRAERADAPTRRSAWRPVLEWTVVGLAAVATTVLVLRGMGDPTAPLDPLVVVAPLLLAFVVCIVTLHAYPVLLRALQSRVQRAVGFTGFVGAARALRDPSTGVAPVLALIVGISISVSSGVMLSTLEAGIARSSQLQAGADLQLQTGRFEEGAADVVAGLDGVAAVAAVAEARSIEVLVDSARRLAPVYFVDQQSLAAVQGRDGTVPEGVSLADGSEPIPLLLSERAVEVLEPGSELSVGGEPAEVAGTAGDTAPFTSLSAWLLTADAYMEAVNGRPAPVVSILVRLDAGADPTAVAIAAQESLGDNVRTLTPASVRSSIEQGPAASALRVTLIACIALAALLCAIAVVMTLVLGTGSRSRILALLQTLGAPPRSGSAIIAWELWPACAAAIIAGTLYGFALPALLLQVVDLRPFTGDSAQPAYAVDPLILLAAIGGFLVVTAVFTLIALTISRRVRAASILRTVEDS